MAMMNKSCRSTVPDALAPGTLSRQQPKQALPGAVVSCCLYLKAELVVQLLCP